MLKLCESIRAHVKKEMGDGDDCWIDLLTTSEIGAIGLKKTDIVVMVASKERWPRSRACTEEIQRLRRELCSRINEGDDKLFRFGSQGHCTADVWDRLRLSGKEVNWWNLVWFKGSVPKFSFVLWLVCQDRLPTRGKILRWEVIDEENCVCCRRKKMCNTCSSNAHSLVSFGGRCYSI
ncbi:hypothetical protein LIER_23569 [Lithospermum erythrorhizon]|uniref:Reverse transcriptase zinc-binding domain-containing protein n=1 Tax=Lithospermum erythrorhizon TaxID=34254 RepID=A0AAV3QY28_LITER